MVLQDANIRKTWVKGIRTFSALSSQLSVNKIISKLKGFLSLFNCESGCAVNKIRVVKRKN